MNLTLKFQSLIRFELEISILFSLIKMNNLDIILTIDQFDGVFQIFAKLGSPLFLFTPIASLQR